VTTLAVIAVSCLSILALGIVDSVERRRLDQIIQRREGIISSLLHQIQELEAALRESRQPCGALHQLFRCPD